MSEHHFFVIVPSFVYFFFFFFSSIFTEFLRRWWDLENWFLSTTKMIRSRVISLTYIENGKKHFVEDLLWWFITSYDSPWWSHSIFFDYKRCAFYEKFQNQPILLNRIFRLIYLPYNNHNNNERTKQNKTKKHKRRTTRTIEWD